MRVKKPLLFSSPLEAIQREVRKHFEDRLPSDWLRRPRLGDYEAVSGRSPLDVLVGLACNPSLMTDAVEREREFGNDGALYQFHDCLARDFDLTLEVLDYARRCLGKRNPGNWCKDKGQASLIRAELMRSHRTLLVKGEESWWRRPTKEETSQIEAHLGSSPSKRKRLRFHFKLAVNLADGEIALWLTKEYGFAITEDSVKAERQKLSKGKE